MPGIALDTYSRLSAGLFPCAFYSIHMKSIASLRKMTKSGVSVWNFVVIEETDQYFAIGGDDLKVIAATDRKHLRQIFDSFKRYGYKKELPSKKQYISDPWASELPATEQMALEALA